MRRLAAICLVAALAAIAAGCGGSGGGKTPAGPTTTAESSCAKDQLNLLEPGTLTIGTGNPAYPPWFEGGSL
jgi:polar amino acid transport system substrate-binding protein